MSDSMKVQPHHLERGAYLYIRQSSMRQVIENVESTKRQYALRNRAIALGWPAQRVHIIDQDLGMSGAAAAISTTLSALTGRSVTKELR